VDGTGIYNLLSVFAAQLHTKALYLIGDDIEQE